MLRSVVLVAHADARQHTATQHSAQHASLDFGDRQTRRLVTVLLTAFTLWNIRRFAVRDGTSFLCCGTR